MFTNTVPVDAYRGAGRPEATYVTERLVEAAAEVTGIDSNGNYIKDQAQEWNEYMLHMLKIQKLMALK